MLIAVTSRIVNASGDPIVGKKVVFTPYPGTYDDSNQVATKVQKVTTDDEGRFILSLWSSPDPYRAARYKVQLPDGSPEFPILVPPYETPKLVQLSYLRGLGRLDPCEEIPPNVPGDGSGIIEDALDKAIGESIIDYNNAVVAPNYVRQREADIVYLKNEDAKKTYVKNEEAAEKFTSKEELVNYNNTVIAPQYLDKKSAEIIYATNERVNNLDLGGGVDLSSYLTIQESKDRYYSKNYIDDTFATEKRVDSILNQFPPFIANYYTKKQIDANYYQKDLLYTKAQIDGTFVTLESANENYAPNGDYATNTRVDTIVAGGTVALEGYYTKTEINEKDFATKDDLADLEIPEAVDLSDYYTKEEIEADYITEERSDDKYYLRGEVVDIGDTRLNIQVVEESTFALDDTHHNTIFHLIQTTTFALDDAIQEGSCFLFVWAGEEAELILQSSTPFVPNRSKFNGFQGDQISLIKGVDSSGRDEVWYLSGSIASPQPEI